MDLVVAVVGFVVCSTFVLLGLYVGVLIHYAWTGCQRCVRRFLPGPVRRLLAPVLELSR